MTLTTDTLAEHPDRVNFSNGMLLDAQDFLDEQAYHRARLAQSLLWISGPGTVGGLHLGYTKTEPEAGSSEPVKEELKLEPGLAIDYAGRSIFVPENYCLDLFSWFEQLREQDPAALNRAVYGAPINGVVADLFVTFATCPRGKMPAFATGPFDALDAVQDSRLRDAFHIDLCLRDRTKDVTPPVPIDRWSTLNAGATLDEVKAAMLDADIWKPLLDTERDQNGEPVLKPRPEHFAGQDPTSVLLARVTIPATSGETSADPPTRDTLRDVEIDNKLRLFVYAPGALLKMA